MQGWILVLGLALHSVASGGCLITSNDTAWWQVVLSPMCVLALCVLLVAKTLPGAWLYHRVQLFYAMGLDWVETGDGC